VVVAVAVLAGAGVGHLVWSNQSASNPSGNSGSGSNGGGNNSPFGGGNSSPFGGGSTSNGNGSTGNSSTGAGAPSDITAIASKVDPGIVDINTNLSYQNEQAAGTGMVLTSDGEVLTNNHVIDGATSISVTDVGNGKTYTASVVGYDRSRDVAVLKLQNASGLQTVKTTNQSPSVGQAIVGIGNAGGAGGTPSTAGGSVTDLNQSITASDSGGANAESLSGLIEINAPIQPGDSGGPLVNTSSQVIGMDTAAAATDGFQVSGSQAYAIPITSALSIARQIEAGQSSSTVHIGTTAFLGVEITPSSSSGNGSNGALGGLGQGSGGSSNTSGAAVAGVVPNGAAAQAGLAQGDVITGFNGHPVTTSTDLSTLMIAQHPGDTVQLQWTDSSGQTHTSSIKLASGPPT
jgi:S1-C subfamily serine protease